MWAEKDAMRPGVAALLGELAAASSIDYVTARCAGRGEKETIKKTTGVDAGGLGLRSRLL